MVEAWISRGVFLAVLLLQFLLSAAVGLPACSDHAMQGQVDFTGNCSWPSQQPARPGSSLELRGQSAGLFPAVIIANRHAHGGQTVPGFYSLSMKRMLLLHNVSLSSPADVSTPKLLPLGLFSTAPANLSMMDVRMLVGPADFQHYLAFFSQHLRAVRTKDDGGVGMHTDGTSFLNIPFWSDNTTELYSVTLVSGPCNPVSAQSSTTVEDLVAFYPEQPGCNVRVATNSTLVPVLLRDATINTTQPLLVRIATNISLGLERPIVIRRPVLLLGTSSAPVSVDLGMVVNQLDVSAPIAQLAWQAVVLENLAPGDATSSIMAAPYSTTVTTNVWAVFCNRSRDMCVPLTNVTIVIPSEDELSYLVFMGTMYNSPSPSLRQLASFYTTDLKMTTFDFVPGNTNDSMKMLHLVTHSWHFWYVVITTQPVFAPPRPVPRQLFNQLQYKTGVLVQGIQDCSSFMATQSFAPDRSHAWQLMNNVSIGGPDCPMSRPINVTGPTTLLGEIAVAAASADPTMRNHPLSAAVPGVAAAPAGNSNSNLASEAQDDRAAHVVAHASRSSSVHTLSFNYRPGLFHLPAQSPDKYLQIRNITLRQLPQLLTPNSGARGSSSSGNGNGSHRRLQQQQQASSVADGASAGVWTMLLWPFDRSLSGAPLYVADSQLVLPQAEWQALLQAAKASRSFALQLADSSSLFFTGVSMLDDSIRVTSFQGPGITGNNVTLLADAQAATAMPGYTWPTDAAAAVPSSPDSSDGPRTGLPVAAQAALGACLGAVGALAAAAAVVLVRRRKHRQRQRLNKQHLKQQSSAQGQRDGPAGDNGRGAGTACSRPPVGQVALSGKDCARFPDQHLDESGGQLDQQKHWSPGHAAAAAAAAAAFAPGAPAAAAAAAGEVHADLQYHVRHSGVTQGSSSSNTASAVALLPPAQSLSEPLHSIIVNSAGSTGLAATTASSCAVDPPAAAQLSEAEQVQQSIAQGLQHWNDAVSLQTMRLMQQRLQASNRSFQRQTTPSTSTSSSTAPLLAPPQVAACTGMQKQPVSRGTHVAPAPAPRGAPSAAGAVTPTVSSSQQDLQLFEVIGEGSFGAVHRGSWRGKQVAVKVMHLPANAFTPGSLPQQQHQQQRLQQQRQQNSRPHMAIMEAVLSTTLHHPNVLRVYTYMLNPLMAQPGAGSGTASSSTTTGQQLLGAQQAGVAAAGTSAQPAAIMGWQLQLVSDYCDQGTLREALDTGRLPRLPNSRLVNPVVAVALSHDIAAAMLHLHTEGIVHGDLKTANVLLQATAALGGSAGTRYTEDVLGVWISSGCMPVTAVVADFGLSLSLGPTDTHATLLARGTPTHMAPELFTSGRISKSSDVYAFGILLNEILTGQRAYAGIAVPLLPHKVAVEGLRPSWPPAGVPAELRALAEACWAQEPQDRPNFGDILTALETYQVQTQGGSSAAQGHPAAVQGSIATAGTQHARPPPPPLPPRPIKPKQQQQQQQQQPTEAVLNTAQPDQQRGHVGAGAGAGAACGGLMSAEPGGARVARNRAPELMWSEVSYGHDV